MALLRVNPEVLVSSFPNFFHRGSVTYLATRECLDLITGKSDIVMLLVEDTEQKSEGFEEPAGAEDA